MFHFAVPLSAGIGALFQFSFDFGIYWQIFLIADGMLKACPEVHSDCTELYLHRHMDLFFRKEYRQPDRQVQTAVNAGLMSQLSGFSAVPPPNALF